MIIIILLLSSLVYAQLPRIESFPSSVIIPDGQDTGASFVYWIGDNIVPQYTSDGGSSWTDLSFWYTAPNEIGSFFIAAKLRVGINQYRFRSDNKDRKPVGQISVIGTRNQRGSPSLTSLSIPDSKCVNIQWNTSVSKIKVERYNITQNSWTRFSFGEGSLYSQYMLSRKGLPPTSNYGNFAYCAVDSLITTQYFRLVDIDTNNILDVLEVSNGQERHPNLNLVMPRRLISSNKYITQVPGTNAADTSVTFAVESSAGNCICDFSNTTIFTSQCQIEQSRLVVSFSRSLDLSSKIIFRKHFKFHLKPGMIINLPSTCDSTNIARATQVTTITNANGYATGYTIDFDFDYNNLQYTDASKVSSDINFNLIWGTVDQSNPIVTSIGGIWDGSINWNHLRTHLFTQDFCQPLFSVFGECGRNPTFNVHGNVGVFGKALLNISYGVQVKGSLFPSPKLEDGSAFLSYSGSVDLGAYADIKAKFTYAGSDTVLFDLPIPLPPQIRQLSPLVKFTPRVSVSFRFDADLEISADGSLTIPYTIPSKSYKYYFSESANELIPDPATSASTVSNGAPPFSWRSSAGANGLLKFQIIPAFTLGISLLSGLLAVTAGVRIRGVAELQVAFNPIIVDLVPSVELQLMFDMSPQKLFPSNRGWSLFSLMYTMKTWRILGDIYASAPVAPPIDLITAVCIAKKPLFSLSLTSMCPKSFGG